MYKPYGSQVTVAWKNAVRLATAAVCMATFAVSAWAQCPDAKVYVPYLNHCGNYHLFEGLPPGISQSISGYLQGMPTAPGRYNFTGKSFQNVTANLTIFVAPSEFVPALGTDFSDVGLGMTASPLKSGGITFDGDVSIGEAKADLLEANRQTSYVKWLWPSGHSLAAYYSTVPSRSLIHLTFDRPISRLDLTYLSYGQGGSVGVATFIGNAICGGEQDLTGFAGSVVYYRTDFCSPRTSVDIDIHPDKQGADFYVAFDNFVGFAKAGAGDPQPALYSITPSVALPGTPVVLKAAGYILCNGTTASASGVPVAVTVSGVVARDAIATDCGTIAFTIPPMLFRGSTNIIATRGDGSSATIPFVVGSPPLRRRPSR